MSLTFDEICIDAHDATSLGGWWSKVLGWPQDVDDDGDVVLHAPPGAGPNWIFLAVPDEKVVKNRIHLDFRPDDQQAEVDRVTRPGCTPCRHRAARRRELGRPGRSGGQRILHSRCGRLTARGRSRRRSGCRLCGLWFAGFVGATARPPTPTPTTSPTQHRSGSRGHRGGWLPDGHTIAPFDVSNPIVGLAGSAVAQCDSERARRRPPQRVSTSRSTRGGGREDFSSDCSTTAWAYLRERRSGKGIRRIARRIETRPGQGRGHRPRRGRQVAHCQRFTIRSVPDLRQRVVALRIGGRQPGPLPAAETQRRGLTVRRAREMPCATAQRPLSRGWPDMLRPTATTTVPSYSTDRRRWPPHPAIPTFAVAFVHAPAISGDTAWVRTAHAW